jgi:hypothetical protein
MSLHVSFAYYGFAVELGIVMVKNAMTNQKAWYCDAQSCNPARPVSPQ